MRHARADAARAKAMPRSPAATAIRIALGALLLAGSAVVLWPGPAHARALPATVDPTLEADAWTDRLVVAYRTAEATPVRRTLLSATHKTQQHLQRFGLQALDSHSTAQGAQVLHLNRWARAAELRKVAAAMVAADPNIAYAEPDLLMQPQSAPNDPMYGQQWHYFEPTAGLNLPAAWDLSTGSGITIAVVDTGVRPHPDLVGNLLAGYDFIANKTTAADGDGRDADATDPGDGCGTAAASWHGTHVAGTLAAVANNNLGVAGVAHGAKLLPVRAMGCGGGYNSDIASGVVWAAGGSVSGVAAAVSRAKVINLSLGSSGSCSATMQSALDQARSLGATVVAAAGNNSGATSKYSPANCRNLIVVTALGREGKRASYANFGAEVDVAAPGGDMATGSANGVLSTSNTGMLTVGSDSYRVEQGTSMATPHVAGVAALMLARNPALTPDEVEVLIKSSTRKIPGACTSCGTGLVDAAAAVRAVFLGSSAPTLVTEVEPNDSHAQAQPLGSFPVKVKGSINRNGDLDTYRISVPAKGTVKARLIGNAESDYNLAFRNAKSVVLATSVRAKGLTDELSWTNSAATAADLFVRVSRASGGVGDSGGRYTLEVTR